MIVSNMLMIDVVKSHEIGVTLSGGGVRAMVGSLVAFEQLKLNTNKEIIKYIGSTSGGSWGSFVLGHIDATDGLNIIAQKIANGGFGEMKTFSPLTCNWNSGNNNNCYGQWKNDVASIITNVVNVTDSTYNGLELTPQRLYSVTQSLCLEKRVFTFKEDPTCSGLACTFGKSFMCMNRENNLEFRTNLANVIKMNMGYDLNISQFDILSLTSSAWALVSVAGLRRKTQELSVTYKTKPNNNEITIESVFLDSGLFCNTPFHSFINFKTDFVISFDFSEEMSMIHAFTKCMKFYDLKKTQTLCGDINLKRGKLSMTNCNPEYLNVILRMGSFNDIPFVFIFMQDENHQNMGLKFPTIVNLKNINYFKSLSDYNDLIDRLRLTYSIIIKFVNNNKENIIKGAKFKDFLFD
jgi:hypothetical protein